MPAAAASDLAIGGCSNWRQRCRRCLVAATRGQQYVAQQRRTTAAVDP